MAWGRSSQSADDLVARLTANTVPSLYVLKFRKFGEDAAVAVARALATNTALTELYASGHDIGVKGAAAFGEALKTNKTLTALGVGGDNMGDEAIAALCAGLEDNVGLVKLDLELKDMGVAGATALGAVFAKHSTLAHVTLCRNAIGNEGAHQLCLGLQASSCSALQHLDVRNNQLTWAGLLHIAEALHHPQIRICELRLCHNGFSKAVTIEETKADADLVTQVAAKLATAPHLRKLWMEDCGLTPAFCEAFGRATAEGGSALESLQLTGNVELSAAALFSTVAPKLHTLCLSRCGVTDASGGELIAAIETMTALRMLDLSHNQVGLLTATGLGLLPHLSTVRLFDNKLGDMGLEVLTGTLCGAGSAVQWEQVDLGVNAITEAGLLQLSTALASVTSTNLQLIELFGNSITPDAEASLTATSESTGIHVAWNARKMEEGEESKAA